MQPSDQRDGSTEHRPLTQQAEEPDDGLQQGCLVSETSLGGPKHWYNYVTNHKMRRGCRQTTGVILLGKNVGIIFTYQNDEKKIDLVFVRLEQLWQPEGIFLDN